MNHGEFEFTLNGIYKPGEVINLNGPFEILSTSYSLYQDDQNRTCHVTGRFLEDHLHDRILELNAAKNNLVEEVNKFRRKPLFNRLCDSLTEIIIELDKAANDDSTLSSL